MNENASIKEETSLEFEQKLKNRNLYYCHYLERFLERYIPQGKKVIDLGCGTGEFLYHVDPLEGLGIDKNEAAITYAAKKYPYFSFRALDIHKLPSDKKYDYVLMIDLLDHVGDMWEVLTAADRVVETGTTIVITTLNPLWQPLFQIAEWFGLKSPAPRPLNFVHRDNLVNLLEIFDYRITVREMLFPIPKDMGRFSEWLNQVIPQIPLLKNLCALQALIAVKEDPSSSKDYAVSVVVPCHNEEDNVERCAETIPQMGKGTEIIFVDDGSTDGTKAKLQAIQKNYSHVKVISYPKNQGKGYAVRRGFEEAAGDILMIFDADLTVPGEDLHEFYYPLAHGKARFVNGSRLVYPLEEQSMRSLNLLGNQFFGMWVSWIIGQRLTDTLCGTKAFFKEDYFKMGIHVDSWGDFDFLFSTKELKLKLVEIPIHYKRRVAGASKMKTFKHGMLLARVCLWGFFNIMLRLSKPKSVPSPSSKKVYY